MNNRPYPSTLRAVIYVRYSSHSQREVSIEQQIRACRRFAERQDIEILDVYEDRALTGTSDKRPGFQKMIRDASHGEWDYVIVYTLDRFARDRYDSAVYKRQLKNHGVKVLSAMENISDDPTGVLMESLLEGLAEYYSKELSQKVLRGHEDNAQKCMVNGALPLGYVKGPDGRYAISEPEAELVREIFTRVSRREPMADIIRDLNTRGMLTKKGKPWNRSSFGRLLSNRRYTGLYIYDGFEKPGGIPAIVTQELFDSVQYAIYSKSNARRDPTGRIPQKRRREAGTYLLTGKLFCGHCKQPMIGVSGTSCTAAPHFYYKCKGRHADKSSCDKKNVRRDIAEQFVATALRDTMFTAEAVRDLSEAAVAYQKSRPERNELLSLKEQLSETERALSNLVSAIEAGIFSAATQSRLMELEARKRDLSRLISEAEADAEDIMTQEEIIATLELFQNGDVADKSYQEALIDTFLVAAYLYDDHVKFVFNLGGSKKDIKIPFDIDSLPLSEVRIDSEQVHQKEKSRIAALLFLVLERDSKN